MTIYLYQITDDRKVVSKTLSETPLATLTATIKSDCDILDPTLEVAYSANIASANYMYIPDWGRYYYLTRKTVGAQRAFIGGPVDVLKSYDSGIRGLKCIIQRQEDVDRCDMYVEDKAFKCESRRIVSRREFPGGFDKDNSSFILTTGGTY